MPQVHVIGELAGALGFPESNLYVHYRFACDSEHWYVIRGQDEGYTQVDQTPGAGGAIWNHPLDVHFGTDSIEGWPKLHLEVWHVDGFDRSELGSYDLDCVTWRPRGTLMQRLSASFLGAPPQLREPGTVASTADRYELSTVTAGTVVAHVEVVTSGFAARNVRVGCPRVVSM